MVNFANIASKIVRALPKTEGAAGKVTLGKVQLEQIAKKGNKKEQQMLQTLLNGAKDPKLEVAYKSQSNYSIAGMRLKDGKNVIGSGAVSITNPGSNQAVVKYRAVLKDRIQANGFIDGGKPASIDDISMGFTRRGGKIKADASIGEATAHHLEANEKGIIDAAKDLNANKLLENYTRVIKKAQNSLDRIMTDARKIFRGETLTPRTEGEITLATSRRIQVPERPHGIMPNKVHVKEKPHGIMPNKVRVKEKPHGIMPNKVRVQEKPHGIMPNKVRVQEKPHGIMPKAKVFDKTAELGKLKELCKTDRIEFEKYRRVLNQKGYQAIFHPQTGELNLVKAKNLDEARRILLESNSLKKKWD